MEKLTIEAVNISKSRYSSGVRKVTTSAIKYITSGGDGNDVTTTLVQIDIEMPPIFRHSNAARKRSVVLHREEAVQLRNWLSNFLEETRKQ